MIHLLDLLVHLIVEPLHILLLLLQQSLLLLDQVLLTYVLSVCLTILLSQVEASCSLVFVVASQLTDCICGKSVISIDFALVAAHNIQLRLTVLRLQKNP